MFRKSTLFNVLVFFSMVVADCVLLQRSAGIDVTHSNTVDDEGRSLGFEVDSEMVEDTDEVPGRTVKSLTESDTSKSRRRRRRRRTSDKVNS
mmetsp:Transcript_25797/g.67621  ORF Transcript_25797/g.67621 Transcript_25797/m.67621 type:complete len:92 (+) Transcript_25797:91-366(+)